MTSVVIRHGNTTLRYRRPVQPLLFPSSEPESESVPENRLHFLTRVFLFTLLRQHLGARSCVGSDQFVYWNARDPKRQCAPDVFVKLGAPDENFASWRTWERGAPELIVEVVSPSDVEIPTWTEKLARFHELGAREVVRFDPDAVEGARLRVWDRIEDDLVERAVENDATPSLTLGLHWIVASAEDLPCALRLARDEAGHDLLLTATEAAQRRIRELEAELASQRR